MPQNHTHLPKSGVVSIWGKHKLFPTAETYNTWVRTWLHQGSSPGKNRSYSSVECAAAFVYIRTMRSARLMWLIQPHFRVLGRAKGMIWFIHAFLWLKSRNNTNAAGGNIITSKVTNWFHVDENIKASEVSGLTV